MDLPKGFFVHLLNANVIEDVSCEKGQFRSFLLASCKNFNANQRTDQTIRWGGTVKILSLTADNFGTHFDREPAHNEILDLCFQTSWVETLLL